MILWDILLGYPFMISVAAVLFTTMLCVYILLPKEADTFGVISILVVLIFVLPFLVINLHGAYQSLRSHSSPPSWQTVEIAADFAFGYFLLDIIQPLAFFIPVALISLVVAPVYILLQKPLKEVFWVGFYVCLALIAILYVLTFFGNCSYYSIGRLFQFILFGNLGQPITSRLIFIDWFWPRCNVVTVHEIKNIAIYPVAVSKISWHLQDALQVMNVSEERSHIFSSITLWLSPMADILGIYLGAYAILDKLGRKKHKVGDTSAG
jgi:hypothetical protein